MRLTSNTTNNARDISLDWVAVQVNYTPPTPTPTPTPTLPPDLVNVAPGAAASASSQNDANYAASNVTDDIIGVPGSGEWASLGELTPWVQLTWPTVRYVQAIQLYDRPNLIDDITAGTLTFSDGSSLPVPALPADGSLLRLTFPAKAITWVRFQVTAGAGKNVGLSEFQVYGLPPVPPYSVTIIRVHR